MVRFRTVGGALLCSADLPATSCATPSTLTRGRYAVVAHYAGDEHYRGARSGRHRLVVTAAEAPTAEAVQPLLRPTARTTRTLDAGTSSTFTATATPHDVGFGHSDDVVLSYSGLDESNGPLTGSVSFTSGATTLCVATLPAVSCRPAADLAAGDYRWSPPTRGRAPRTEPPRPPPSP